MNSDWQELESTTHQDHVIAHVLDATLLGYFIHDETIHLVLDMGFIWSIYLDGQMVLLPTGVALDELEMEGEAKSATVSEVESLLTEDAPDLTKTTAMRIQISSVRIYEEDQRRMIEILGEEDVMRIVSSLTTRGFEVS